MISRAGVTVAALLALSVAPASGQAPLPTPDPTGRSGDRPPVQREELRRDRPPGQILPPLAPVPRAPERFPDVRVVVREIRVVGSTVFTARELAEVTRPYVGRTVTAEELEALRVALTLLYVQRGYVSSGAILPDQTVADGIVTYQIVEGRVTGVEVTGNEWFRSSYLERRLRLAVGPPLDIDELQERLQMLLEDPRLRRINATLRPGARPGESVLAVAVEEPAPFRASIDVNNHQAPSVGAERVLVALEHLNVTGNGDIFTIRYGASSGLDPLLDLRYILPVTARDTTVALQYRRNAFTVIEEPFTDLDIESETDVYTVAVRHPVYRTLDTEAALELSAERLSSETTLFGEPFTLTEGASNGESVVVALRAGQELVRRSRWSVIAARSRFSVGIDALDATIHDDDRPDGRFFAWLGQAQWVQRLPLLDTQLVARTDLQLTNDALLPLEQFSVGGRFTVRGYRENTFLRDNAFTASLEARVPIVSRRSWADFVELAPFVDYGRAWNARSPRGEPLDIASVGIGLRWALSVTGVGPFRPYFEVYWGHPLRDVDPAVSGADDDLQDHGLHFQFVLGVF